MSHSRSMTRRAPRTTHSDMARELCALAAKRGERVLIDASLAALLAAAAQVIAERDQRVDSMTVALREARSSMSGNRDSASARDRAAFALVNAELGLASKQVGSRYCPECARSNGPNYRGRCEH